MAYNDFQVRISKKDTVWLTVFLFAAGIALAVLSFGGEHALVSRVMAGILLVLGVAAILVTVLFRVQVTDSTICVRTRLGKRYQFECSDIEEVTCITVYSSKYGPSYRMELKAGSHTLTLVATWTGFQEMAGYLLEKYKNGRIMPAAISVEDQEALLRYKNGEIFRKKD